MPRPQLLSWLARADLQAGKTNQALAASRSPSSASPMPSTAMNAKSKFSFTTTNWAEALRTLNRAAAKSIRPDPPALVALGGLYAAYLKTQPKDAATKTNAVSRCWTVRPK